ncbi:MAG: squalene/phytoene synthase family protein [Gammaproteobacteria bacterium]|nr:MAG: squalene/phytoene synthase family protein [Gammaproteobacteria bacterium]
MPDSFDHCEALVRAADKDRFLATLFAPARCRRPLFALYAFNIEVARVRELAREPMPGEIRLQWWRDVFSEAGGSEARAHPVAAALTNTIVRYRLPLSAFSDLIEARAFDLYDDPMPSLEALEAYAGKTSAALIVLAMLILEEGKSTGLGTLAGHAGIAHAIAGLLASLGQHAARRQLYVPLDVLRRHGARVEDVFAGKATLELCAALAEMRLHARRHLTEAKALMASAPPAAMPALLPASLARVMLDRMERRSYDPFKVVEVPQWRRQWALWRAARRPAQMFD